MKDKPGERKPFYFTATYMPVNPVRGMEDWYRFAERKQQEQAAAMEANRPMEDLTPEDHQFLVNMGVNGFHMHGWRVKAETAVDLLEEGFLLFSYQDDFYFLDTERQERREHLAACMDKIRDLFYGRKGPFLLCAVLESVCPHTGESFSWAAGVASRKEAYDVYKKFFFEKGGGFFAPYRDYCAHHGIDPLDLKTVCGIHQQWHHYAAEWGAGVLFSEGNCNLVNDQVRTAMIRGAAHQYDRPWFLYQSSWGGVDRQLTTFDSEGRQQTGITPSLSLRQWIGSFYAGADVCGGIENPGSQMFYVNADGERVPSAFAHNVRDFTDFVFKRHPDRGVPFVPVGLMLDVYHGWEPREHRVWGGALPYTRDEEMIDNVFNAAFPGQEQPPPNDLSGWHAHRNPFPWGGQAELFAMQKEHRFDHRVYEKGFRVDSTWGDSFDVVLSNCPLEVLQRYPALMLLGRMEIDDTLQKKLNAYVEGGGVLVLNVNHVTAEHGEWLGVEFCGRREILWEVRCSKCGRVFRDGEAELELVRPTTAYVLYEAIGGCRRGFPEVKRVPGYDGADPVATCRRVGKGEMILTTLPYMQTTARRPLHPACCDLVDHLVHRLLPVDVQGPPVEYLINRTEDGWIVTLMNNGPDYWRGETTPEAWQGRIILRGISSDRVKRVMELWTDRDISFADEDGTAVVPVEVEPFGFKIVQLQM